jgi:hypothetical protein
MNCSPRIKPTCNNGADVILMSIGGKFQRWRRADLGGRAAAWAHGRLTVHTARWSPSLLTCLLVSSSLLKSVP